MGNYTTYVCKVLRFMGAIIVYIIYYAFTIMNYVHVHNELHYVFIVESG